MSSRNLCFDDFCIHNIKSLKGTMDALEKREFFGRKTNKHCHTLLTSLLNRLNGNI
jgi:hypothetical protein